MSWLSTKTASYVGVSEDPKPSDIQKKVFHLKFDYRVYNQNKPVLSPIVKKYKHEADPKLMRKRRRKLRIRNKKRKRLQQQHAFQKAKQNLLSILYAEKDMKHEHLREVMELSWNSHKHIILKGETHGSPIHHRLQEIHEKEMVLLAAAKKGTQKKMRAKEIGLNEGKEHHELVDEDIYKLALEFAEKKENKEKVDKVKLDFQKQKLEAGLSKYVEEKRIETRDGRKLKAEESAKNVSEKLHANIERPASRESRPQSREGSSSESRPTSRGEKQKEGQREKMDIVLEKNDDNKKDVKQKPESESNVKDSKLKDVEKSSETHSNLIPIKDASPRPKIIITANDLILHGHDIDGYETENLDDAGKELYYQALGISPEGKAYRKNKFKASIKYQANITKKMIEGKKRVWALREKHRPVHRKYLELPEGYEMKDGQFYTLRSYSHCNGFINPHLKYVGVRPHRCCPTRGEPRHLFDRSFMLLEKVEKHVESNKYVGRWTAPVYHWLRDFVTRQDALDFSKQYGIKDIRF